MNLENLLPIPILTLNQSTKTVVFELKDGTRFCIVGGKCRRPPSKGVAGFTPAEMVYLLREGFSESELKQVIEIKGAAGGGRLVEFFDESLTTAGTQEMPPSGS